MLSIDEAIEKYKEITNTKAICPGHCNISCDKCLQESKQIAEWLEELKATKSSDIPIIHGKEELELHDKAIRNKAIDDFVKFTCIDSNGFKLDHLINEKVYKITYVLNGWGIKNGFVVFGIKECESE